jgi:TrmH family RNA methyltransferase
MLTSTKNPRIQHIRKLQSSARTRRKEGSFVAEGVRLVEEALTAGWRPELVLFTEEINDRGRQAIDRFRALGVEVLAVAPQVMRAASDTQTPQGILAMLPIPQWDFPATPTFLLIPDGVRDPGNLGTLLRTALAAGVEAVILPPGGADAFSPKVVRSGMGAHFKLPIISMEWEAIDSHLAGLNVFLADSAGGQPHFEARFEAPLALIIGGEAAGAGNQAAQLAIRRVHIPMTGETESLNAAIAGAILMFEVVRQRG